MGRKPRYHHLTEEQKQLAADNVSLVEWYLRRMANKGRLRQDEVEDCRSFVYLSLCIAAEMFNPALGFKFSTFANTVFRTGFSAYYKFRNSRNTVILATWMLDTEKNVEQGYYIEELLGLVKLSELDREIMLLKYQKGYTNRAIGIMKGFSSTTTKNHITAVIEKLKYAVKRKELIMSDFHI